MRSGSRSSACRSRRGCRDAAGYCRLVGARLPSTRAGWLWAIAIGAGNVTLTLAGIAEGTRLAGAAVASVLLNSAPFFAAVFARLLLGEGLTRLRLAGLVAGFGGILLIVATEPSSGRGSHVVEGMVVCLAGAVGWAAAGLAHALSERRRPALRPSGGRRPRSSSLDGVLLIPYLIASGGAHASNWSSPKLWASLVFLVIGAQVITYVGFYVALAQWTSARVFAWTFLAPAVAVVIEALQGNLPGALTTIGLAIVIAGVATVTHPRAEAPIAG